MLGWTAAGEVLMRAPDGLALLGKTRRAIALPEPGTVLDAQVSPDGRSIAMKLGEYEQDPQTELTYVHSTGLWVLGLTGGGWREIVDLSGRPPAVLSHGGEGLLWSPEATRLVYQTEGGGESTDWETRLVDVRTGEEELLAAEYSWGRSWSRDGRYLAYMQSASGYSAGSLQILGPDGRTRRMANVRQMAWTKDGRLMVDIPGHLSLLDPETMRIEEVLTEDGESISALLEAPVWSPSGRYLALATPADMYHRSSIYIIDTEKGTAELFLDKAGFAPVAWLRE
jgi:Tol biopolymer transport system component